MQEHRLIIFNTVVNYTQTVLAAFLAIFSSRWLLEALGVSNLGLFALVGGLIAFIGFVNGVFAGCTVRFFAFYIGKNDREELNKWFNSSIAIHITIPCILIVIGWPIAEYCIRHVLDIAPERLNDALWIFRISLAVSMVSMINVPYAGLLNAYQKIAQMAILNLAKSIATFVFIYCLLTMQGNRLIIYAIFTGSISVLGSVVIFAWVKFGYPESRLNFKEWWDLKRFKALFSYSAWTFWGTLAGMLRQQGIGIVLNLHFGTALNATYSITNSVVNQATNLSNSLQGALAPAISSNTGMGNSRKICKMVLAASKYGTLLFLFLALPLFMEMNYIINLWLKTPPPFVIPFCQCILLATFFDKLSVGHMIGINASGKVAKYQAAMGTINMLPIPLSILLLVIYNSPFSVMIALTLCYLLVGVGRSFFGKSILGISIAEWFNQVVLRIVLALLTPLAVGIAIMFLLPLSLTRFLISGICMDLCLLAGSWYIVLDKDMRKEVQDKAFGILAKLAQQRKCPE